MNEADRRARNTAKLAECHPAFRARLAAVLTALTRQGFRPRIQEAYRSPEDQMRAYQRGTSKLRYGLHNATGAGGKPESLAADVLDDDHPTAPPRRYLLALAVAAKDAELETGILWGLSGSAKVSTDAAVRTRRIDADVRMGWDPTHTQAVGISASEARAGHRPPPYTAPAAPPEEDVMTPEQEKKLDRTLAEIADLREALAAHEKSEAGRFAYVLHGDTNPAPGDQSPGHNGIAEVIERLDKIAERLDG